jgi:hypothetical protein
MDTSAGLRIGSVSSPSFSVSMDGSMTATNATIQKTVGGNTIILDNNSLRAVGSTGSTVMGYDGTITATQSGTWPFGNASIKVASGDTNTVINPGGYTFHQDSIFGSAVVDIYQYIYNNQWVSYATGLTEITWANFYVNTSSPYNYPSSKVSTVNGDDFRPLGITPFGGQYLGQRMFSGTATSNSTINSDISGRGYANQSLNGDFYFSTA